MDMNNVANTPNSSPISRLYADLLLRIFSINANMEADKQLPKLPFFKPKHAAGRALNTTRHSSQVCHDWREMIINSCALWGKIFDLDILSYPEAEMWRNEVLGRGQGSPLHVKGSTTLGRFFPSFLNENWDRIVTFELGIIVDMSTEANEVWKVLRHPAPNLRFFQVSIAKRYWEQVQVHSTWEIPSDPACPLFANNAPSLQEFSSKQMSIDLPAPWLSNLRRLEFTSFTEFSIDEFLEAFQGIHLLESLSIFQPAPFSAAPLLSSDLLPHISLPRLEEIRLSSWDLAAGLQFLDHVKPSSGCSLSLDASFTDDTFTEAFAEAVHRTIGRYASGYFQSHSPHLFRLGLCWDFQCGVADAYSFFSLKISTVTNLFDVSVYTILLDVFSAVAWNEVITFDFHGLDLSVVPSSYSFLLISKFTCVQLLEVKNDNLLENLRRAFEYAPTVFPVLRTLKMRSLHTAHTMGGQGPGALVPFLEWRKCSASPIKVLDLGGWTNNRNFNLAFLDEVKGLVVRGVRGRKEAEYVCGSGKPDKLLIGHRQNRKRRG